MASQELVLWPRSWARCFRSRQRSATIWDLDLSFHSADNFKLIETQTAFHLIESAHSLDGPSENSVTGSLWSLITKVLNVHDPMIGMMGALSWVTSFMVWALATQGWMMYLATGLSSIGTYYREDNCLPYNAEWYTDQYWPPLLKMQYHSGGLTSTPIVTLLTKLVDKEEMGAVMAMCSGENIISNSEWLMVMHMAMIVIS